MQREAYDNNTTLNSKDLIESLTHPGFLKMASSNVEYGLSEIWKDVSVNAYVKSLQKYYPFITVDHIGISKSGVRALAMDHEGMVEDFVFEVVQDGKILHVRNAPSPAATACLVIGDAVEKRAMEVFGEIHV